MMDWLRRRFGRSGQSASEQRLFAELRELKERLNRLGAVYFPLVERKVMATTTQIAQLRTDFQALAKEVHAPPVMVTCEADHGPIADLFDGRPTSAPVHEEPVRPIAPPWNIRLQHLMKAAGFDRNALALMAGTHRGNISKILSGKHIPNGPVRRRIADALGVTEDFIFPAKPPRKRTVKVKSTETEGVGV